MNVRGFFTRVAALAVSGIPISKPVYCKVGNVWGLYEPNGATLLDENGRPIPVENFDQITAVSFGVPDGLNEAQVAGFRRQETTPHEGHMAERISETQPARTDDEVTGRDRDRTTISERALNAVK